MKLYVQNKNRNDSIEDKGNFEEHIQKHEMWKYIRYICNFILQNKKQYTCEEYYAWKQIKKRRDWFLKAKS